MTEVQFETLLATAIQNGTTASLTVNVGDSDQELDKSLICTINASEFTRHNPSVDDLYSVNLEVRLRVYRHDNTVGQMNTISDEITDVLQSAEIADANDEIKSFRLQGFRKMQEDEHWVREWNCDCLGFITP